MFRPVNLIVKQFIKVQFIQNFRELYQRHPLRCWAIDLEIRCPSARRTVTPIYCTRKNDVDDVIGGA